MKLIKKKRLLRMGFTFVESESNNERSVYINRCFKVKLIKGRKDYPIISIDTPVLESDDTLSTLVVYPGAYTLKNLCDLMFFYLGENEYTEFTQNWSLPQILKITKPKFTKQNIEALRNKVTDIIENADDHNDDTELVANSILELICDSFMNKSVKNKSDEPT